MEFMVWVVRKCGLGREIMVLGQALVAGSMVQGEKLWSWVKRWWRAKQLKATISRRLAVLFYFPKCRFLIFDS